MMVEGNLRCWKLRGFCLFMFVLSEGKNEGEFRDICSCEDCVCVALGVRGENLYVAAFVCTQFWE